MLERASGERSYGQYCPVAAGLDLIGDRWVLLICRELLDGPRGFNEIKRALPGLASNLLTTRLRTMSADGLVTRSADGYALTGEGRSVIPVLRAVARFGVSALNPQPPEQLDALRTARGFLLPWLSARDLPPLVVVRTPDGSAVDIVRDEQGVRLRPREAGEPEPAEDVVTLYVDPTNLAELRRDGAAFRGHAEGPARARERVLAGLGFIPTAT